MSRRIKKVRLVGNTVFPQDNTGGYGDQRTDFTASEACKLSVDTELGGVLVEKPGLTFTVPFAAISYVEWFADVPKPAKVKPPESNAA